MHSARQRAGSSARPALAGAALAGSVEQLPALADVRDQQHPGGRRGGEWRLSAEFAQQSVR
jgi:hypothetical protein